MHKKISNTLLNAFIGLVLLIVLGGCSPLRRLDSKNKLLNKVSFNVDDKTIDKSELADYVRQTPNRRFLNTIRLYLQIYNLVSPEKAKRDHDRKLERKNKRRAKKGKTLLETEDVTAFREWIQGIGEPPTVYDTSFAEQSVKELTQYLFNNGYFFAKVKDSLVEPKPRYINQLYNITAGRRYTIKTKKWDFGNDSTIARVINAYTNETLINEGDYFNVDNISAERDRIVKVLKQNGYFFFNVDNIKVEADTTIGNNSVAIEMVVSKPKIQFDAINYPDSLIEGENRRYYIGKVFVNTQYDPLTVNTTEVDTIVYNGIYYLFPKNREYNLVRPKALDYHIYLRQYNLYKEQDQEATINRLRDLRVYRFLNIQYSPADTSKENTILNTFILLTPSLRRTVSAETQGTATGNNLGINASISYANKNIFRGAESFEFKVRGGLESQPILFAPAVEDNRVFNTTEFGASMALNFPRAFFPFNYIRFNKDQNPKTRLVATVNYQQRPDYTRTIYNISYGWRWQQSKRLSISYNPIEVNFLNSTLSNEFNSFLETQNNILYRNSFKNVFIQAGTFNLTWTNQVANKRKNYIFARLSAESAGFLLSLIGSDSSNLGGYKTFLGRRFAQYYRIDFEVHPNFYLGKTSALAFRIYGGYARPYSNSNVMPFEKAFFAGGTNGMRGWIQRQLGPGNLDRTLFANQIDQFGDIKIEFNAEYRQKVISLLELAPFVDIGNIWLGTEDSLRPGAEFRFNDLRSQFAVNYGLGIRLDFGFFLLRLDLAHQLYNPNEIAGNRYVKPAFSNIRGQIGIGYPF